MRRSPAAVLIAVLLLAACAGDDPGETADVDVESDPGKADGYELYVRVAGTSLWLDSLLDRRVSGERTDWVLSGRTSRNLEGGFGFIFDDPVGEFAQVSARRFEVAYAAPDRGLGIGGQHFVNLSFASGTPESMTARVLVRPRLLGFSGAGATIEGDVVPVWDGHRFVWRVHGRTWSAAQRVDVEAGGNGVGTVTLLDGRDFRVDLDEFELARWAGSDSTLYFHVRTAGGTQTKRARLELTIKKFGFTSGDPYEVWPPFECDPDVRTCLEHLAPGGDTEICGDAREVMTCGLPAPFVFDDVAFAAAMDRVDALLTDPAGFAGDVDALVGDDRVDQYSEAVRMLIEHQFEVLYGTAFTTAAELDQAVQGVIDVAIDMAYARPFKMLLEAPHAPAPGSVAGTRQVVADYLLLRLAEMDLQNTEFGRGYDDLVKMFRARHVADLRALREQVTPVDGGGGRDVYVGNWLDPYIEVRVNRSTGVAETLLFEID